MTRLELRRRILAAEPSDDLVAAFDAASDFVLVPILDPLGVRPEAERGPLGKYLNWLYCCCRLFAGEHPAVTRAKARRRARKARRAERVARADAALAALAEAKDWRGVYRTILAGGVSSTAANIALNGAPRWLGAYGKYWSGQGLAAGYTVTKQGRGLAFTHGGGEVGLWPAERAEECWREYNAARRDEARRATADKAEIIARLQAGEPVWFKDGQKGGRFETPNSEWPEFGRRHCSTEGAARVIGAELEILTPNGWRPWPCWVTSGYVRLARRPEPEPHWAEEVFDRAYFGHRAAQRRSHRWNPQPG